MFPNTVKCDGTCYNDVATMYLRSQNSMNWYNIDNRACITKGTFVLDSTT